MLQTILDGLYDNLGALAIAVAGVALAYHALRLLVRVEQRRLDFEKKKFDAEAQERREIRKFREAEYHRFEQPAAEIADHLTTKLVENPAWAAQALELAKLAPYAKTMFGERTQHFRNEKAHLAERFVPYLLSRCRRHIEEDGRHVYLLVDAGSTLYPFFQHIALETAKAFELREGWLDCFHLATNNLPGMEVLMQHGRSMPLDRYSKLAIEDCLLLPGIPIPVFAAVAGRETDAAIRRLRELAIAESKADPPVFIALVVGNWVRIGTDAPRCPIPMARGEEHLSVKQTLMDNADEVFVVSPLGKMFVDQSNADVNAALGFQPDAKDPEKAAYDEVELDVRLTAITKLVSTCRQPDRLLHRHSNRLEDALRQSGVTALEPDDLEFRKEVVSQLPHLLFPFNALPDRRDAEFVVEFPHTHTRTRPRFLEMFSVHYPFAARPS